MNLDHTYRLRKFGQIDDKLLLLQKEKNQLLLATITSEQEKIEDSISSKIKYMIQQESSNQKMLYNEAIRALETTINKNQNSLEKINSDNDEIKEDILVVKEDIVTLKQGFQAMKQDISVVKEDIVILKQDIQVMKNEIISQFNQINNFLEQINAKISQSSLQNENSNGLNQC